MSRLKTLACLLSAASSVVAGSTPEYGQDLAIQDQYIQDSYYDLPARPEPKPIGSLFGMDMSQTSMPPYSWVEPSTPTSAYLPPKPIVQPFSAPAAPTHRVVSGDTLWDIAARYCGSGPQWKNIYDANRNKISNPHWIYPGQEFQVACGPGQATPEPPVRLPPTTPPSDTGAANGNGPHRIQPPALTFAGFLPLDPGTYTVGQTIGADRDGGARKHEGIDLMAPAGTPIRSIGAGTVTRVGHIGGYGWVVYVEHPNGFETRYAHMNGRPPVQVGQRVQAGERIGAVGASGNANGVNHIHFEVRNASDRVLDPHDICKF